MSAIDPTKPEWGDYDEWSVRNAFDCNGNLITVYLRVSEFADRFEAFRYHQLALNDHQMLGCFKLGTDDVQKLQADIGDRPSGPLRVGGVGRQDVDIGDVGP